MKTAIKDFSITFGANYLPIENRNTADAEFCSTFKTTTKSNNMDERNGDNLTPVKMGDMKEGVDGEEVFRINSIFFSKPHNKQRRVLRTLIWWSVKHYFKTFKTKQQEKWKS